MAVGGLMLIPVTAAVGSFQLGLRSVGGERGDDSEWNQFIAYRSIKWVESRSILSLFIARMYNIYMTNYYVVFNQ